MTFEHFVGLSYADKGRGPAFDCWGLVQFVFCEMCGIDLPSYSEAYVTAADRRAIADLIAGELDPWTEIAAGTEQTFDCVLMSEGRVPRHVGVVTAPGRLLHVSEGITSRIEPYRTGPLRHRVVGFYRYSGP